MVAFSSDHLGKIVIPLLFAVFGGSIAAFGKDLTDSRRREAYAGLLALSLFCTVGIVVGVLAVQYRWLSPAVALNGNEVAPSAYYLRSQTTTNLTAIQMEVRQGLKSKDQAYDELIQALTADAAH